MPLVLITLVLAAWACQIPGLSNASAELPTEAPTATVTDTLVPTNTSETPLDTETLTPTITEETTPTPVIAPTETATGTNTPTAVPTALVTSTLSPNAFYPDLKFGVPDFIDDFTYENYWKDSSDRFPDTAFIRINIVEERLVVTGKAFQTDTWYFNGIEVGNFYMEMRVNTGNCAGKDSYGLIVRGNKKEDTPTHGYAVYFACDGTFRVRRIDGIAEGYDFKTLIDWRGSVDIRKGPNAVNEIGILAIGPDFAVYANGVKVGEFTDTRYQQPGRFGIFVNASTTENFTWSADLLRYWENVNP